MMAATGVGAQTIADNYNTNPWGTTSTNPIVGTTTYNNELDAILDSNSSYPYNISTWTDSTSANNGLNVNIYQKGNTTAIQSMMGYLTDAYNDLEQLKSNPPVGMTTTDLSNMQNTIKKWAWYGLDDNKLGLPT